MHRKYMRRGMMVALAIIAVIFLLSPGPTFAGVGASDTPTVPATVKVGQTNVGGWSFTIENAPTVGNQTHSMEITSMFFITACGSSGVPGTCLSADNETPGEITINTPATGTGGACAGRTFKVTATGNPNEYKFEPLSPSTNVILDPTIPSGGQTTCTVSFTVNISSGPTKDSSGDPGKQTSQHTRVLIRDTQTNQTGGGTGTSTVTVNLCNPTIETTPDPPASTIPPTPTVLNDKARLIPDPTCPSNVVPQPTGTITFNLYDVNDQECNKAAICTRSVGPPSGNLSACISPLSCEPSTGCSVTKGGVYHWIANYSGDTNNNPVDSACAAEPVPVLSIVTTQNPTSACPGAVINDSATLSGGKEPVGGTITFRLFGPDDGNCSKAAICTKTKNVSANGTYDTISLGGCTADKGPGTYHWTACYSGDATNNPLPVPLCSPCTGTGSEPVDIKDIPVEISTEANPTRGCIGAVLNDSATLKGGCEPPPIGGTITFKLYGPDNDSCSDPPIHTETVDVTDGTGTYSTSEGHTATETGTYHWRACYSGNGACTPCLDPKEKVVIDECKKTGESPYIGIVGNDCVNYSGSDSAVIETCVANPFYFSEKHRQFLFDQEAMDVPVCWGTVPPFSSQTRVPMPPAPSVGCEQFRSNKPMNQPEICDMEGQVVNYWKGDFKFEGEPNAVITKGSAGSFEWWIRLPKKPNGEINICIQCGILKPNTFRAYEFDALALCAAETGERVGRGTCTRNWVDADVSPIVNSALPKIMAWAYPGPNAPDTWKEFRLTAYKNPGTYNLSTSKDGGIDADPADAAPAEGPMRNSVALQVLDGTPAARILLKSCMDKCVVVKLPVADQVNARGDTEQDLQAGDLIKVRLDIPNNNTVDIYCHSQSTKIMGIGVPQ